VAERVMQFSDDIKESVRVVSRSPRAPAFPSSLWKYVLLDEYVDFNLVLANAFAPEPDRGLELVLGTSSGLEISKPKLVSQITTAAQWNNAFWIYSEAVNFAFPGRVDELRTYNRHINNIFASRHESFHHRVLSYDRAARVKIGQTGSLLLDDVSSLAELRDAHLSDSGLYVVQVKAAVERQPKRERSDRSQKRGDGAEVCRNYNRRACTLAHCRFRHSCLDC
ncbi:hypothetical protein C8F01DRAFT_920609, partial [Mycena amicta]